MLLTRRQLLACAGLSALLSACRSVRPPAARLLEKEGSIRVACIGDSITYGAGIQDREKNSYPAVLAKQLPPRFEVGNFGVSGATLLKKGDLPYWNQPEFAAADHFKPDAVIIKLGTNDTKPQNWRHKEAFARDLKAMISHFSALPSHPKVFLCLPVPVYETQWGISDDILVNGVIPVIKKTAQETNTPLIDLYDALSGRPDLFPDKIHPNADGAAQIARTISAALLGR